MCNFQNTYWLHCHDLLTYSWWLSQVLVAVHELHYIKLIWIQFDPLSEILESLVWPWMFFRLRMLSAGLRGLEAFCSLVWGHCFTLCILKFISEYISVWWVMRITKIGPILPALVKKNIHFDWHWCTFSFQGWNYYSFPLQFYKIFKVGSKYPQTKCPSRNRKKGACVFVNRLNFYPA